MQRRRRPRAAPLGVAARTASRAAAAIQRRAAIVAPVVAILVLAAPAQAAHPLTRGISDGGAFVTSGDPRLAALALSRGARAGARGARLPLIWPLVERAELPPADPSNPADPAYSFAAFDALVRTAVRHGLEPLVRIDGAPRTHEAAGRWRFARPNVWAPDAAAYGRFATAAARRYSGSFPDPLHPGAFLPRVRLWQAWNEPNLPQFLQPQWVVSDGAWAAWSPAHYRRMLNAFYAGVKSVHRDNVVATAGTAPHGEPRDGEGRMTPMRFWQALLCLGKPPRITLEPCPDPAHFDVLVHHPLTVTDPDVPSANAGDVSIADLYKLKRLLSVAQRTGRVVPARGTRLWVTELNWDSRPPDPEGATREQMTRWIPRALYRLWVEGVDLVTWQFLRDPPAKEAHPAGLYRIDPAAPADPTRDRPKRAVIAAFRFPLTGARRDPRHVSVWTLLPRARAERVAVQRRHGERWVTLRHLRSDAGGVARGVVALHGAAALRISTRRQGASVEWHTPAS
jgi:hypothetical protein